MMRIENNKGITLIALIVTIIVLIIIAGISIATLTADNGILRQVNVSKVTQIEGTAREQMDLACAALRLAIAEAHAQDNSYSAKENASAIQEVLLSTVKADTMELEEAGWKEGTLDATAGTFVITYEGEDYKNACNDDNAVITYTVTLSQKSIEVTDVGTGLKDTAGNNVVLDVGSAGITGSGSGSGDVATTLDTPTISVSGDTLTIIAVTNATSYDVYVDGTFEKNITSTTLDLTTLNLEAGDHEITVKAKAEGYTDSEASISASYTVAPAVTYLVDEVDIGDYVNIGISYTNYTSPNTNYLSGSDTTLTGWRVLSTSGSGENGIVTLVSAGAPLSFYYAELDSTSTALGKLASLGTSISLVTSGTGFRTSGFQNQETNLQTLWNGNSNIDTSVGVHGLTIGEIITAYNTLTGKTNTQTNMYAETDVCKTSEMIDAKSDMLPNAYDLLGNGMQYYLGGESRSYTDLYYVTESGDINFTYDNAIGVRVVVTLKTNTQISGTAGQDGLSPSTAFTLKPNSNT